MFFVFVIYMWAVADQLPRLGKRELICLLSFTCNYVVSVWRGSLVLWVLWMGCIISLLQILGLPCTYLARPSHSSSWHWLETIGGSTIYVGINKPSIG